MTANKQAYLIRIKIVPQNQPECHCHLLWAPHLQFYIIYLKYIKIMLYFLSFRLIYCLKFKKYVNRIDPTFYFIYIYFQIYVKEYQSKLLETNKT